jgi:hypothetical protein
MGRDKSMSRRKFISNASLAFPMIVGASGSPLASIFTPDIHLKGRIKVGVDADKLYVVKGKGAFVVLDYASEIDCKELWTGKKR